MVLPHDANHGKPSKDSKLFAVFVVFSLAFIGAFSYYISK